MRSGGGKRQDSQNSSKARVANMQRRRLWRTDSPKENARCPFYRESQAAAEGNVRNRGHQSSGPEASL